MVDNDVIGKKTGPWPFKAVSVYALAAGIEGTKTALPSAFYFGLRVLGLNDGFIGDFTSIQLCHSQTKYTGTLGTVLGEG